MRYYFKLLLITMSLSLTLTACQKAPKLENLEGTWLYEHFEMTSKMDGEDYHSQNEDYDLSKAEGIVILQSESGYTFAQKGYLNEQFEMIVEGNRIELPLRSILGIREWTIESLSSTRMTLRAHTFNNHARVPFSDIDRYLETRALLTLVKQAE